MIQDILFGGIENIDTNEFILEKPATASGLILSYSLDGKNYDFTISDNESVSIIIN